MTADKLRDLRTKYNLTQRELADALGVTHTYISKIERGKAQPSAQFVKNCARVFDVRVDNLQRGPTVTRRDDGRVNVRIHFVDSVINDDELHELFAQIARAQGTDLVQGPDSAEPCTRCGDNPRAWVRSTFCGACIAAQLREDLQREKHCDVCDPPHGGCGAECDGYG